MKTLYLVRHAKAVSRGKPGPDFARPLSPRGKTDAQKMAKYVKKKGPSPDLIISSPAKRALRTARIFAAVCCYPVARIATHEAIYEHSDEADTLLNIIQTVANAHQTIMIFGHDPLFTALAHSLYPDFTGAMPPCGVACFEFPVLAWSEISPGRGTLRFFHYPAKGAKRLPLLEAELRAKIVAQLYQALSDLDPEIAGMVEKSLSKAGAKLARKFVKKLQAAKVSLPHENQPEE